MRAVVGWEEPIVHGGKVVGEKRHYSDSLLRLLIQREMKAATPPRPRAQDQLVAEAKRSARAAGG